MSSVWPRQNHMQMCVSEVRLVDYTRLLGRQGDLTAELCAFPQLLCVGSALRCLCDAWVLCVLAPWCAVRGHASWQSASGIQLLNWSRGLGVVWGGGGGLMQRASVSRSSVCWAAAIHFNRGVFHDKNTAWGACLDVIGFPSICSLWSLIKQDSFCENTLVSSA